MPELIELGYIYIAQPPLYKVRKGKQEYYVKDDIELNDYLLQLAIDKAELYLNAEAPPIRGPALESLAREYLAVAATIERLKRRLDSQILQALIYMAPVTEEMIEDRVALSDWLRELSDRINTDRWGEARYELDLRSGQGAAAVRITWTRRVHGIETTGEVTEDFFHSAEYRSILALGEKLEGLLGEGARIERGERHREINSFRQALDWLMDEARRGQHIQRYKGLGEMNPGQLWETTMNTETRRLMQINIEDAVAADDVFTTLMGDHVEPRREFIERNALAVGNLDI
jgi:DNA gyrase subunit B